MDHKIFSDSGVLDSSAFSSTSTANLDRGAEKWDGIFKSVLYGQGNVVSTAFYKGVNVADLMVEVTGRHSHTDLINLQERDSLFDPEALQRLLLHCDALWGHG